MLAPCRSAHGPVVLRTAVTAGDPNRLTCEITKLLQRVHKPRVDFRPAAAATFELVPGEVFA